MVSSGQLLEQNTLKREVSEASSSSNVCQQTDPPLLRYAGIDTVACIDALMDMLLPPLRVLPSTPLLNGKHTGSLLHAGSHCWRQLQKLRRP